MERAHSFSVCLFYSGRLFISPVQPLLGAIRQRRYDGVSVCRAMCMQMDGMPVWIKDDDVWFTDRQHIHFPNRLFAVHLPFYLHRTAITTNKVDTLYRKTQHGLLFLMWRHTATHRQNVQCGFAYLLFKPLVAFTCICLCACYLNHRNADDLQVRQNRLSGFFQTLSTHIIYLFSLYFK